jgi:hypothetical protein
MNSAKKKRLQAKGWKIGTVDEFLNSSSPYSTKRKELLILAQEDFDIRHAGGGPFDEIDVKNSFVRGYMKCLKENNKQNANKNKII